MRNPKRIPIIIENIDWFDFLKYLSEKFGDFTVKKSKKIAEKISLYGSENIQRYWETNSDQRLTQVLLNLNLFSEATNALYSYEETEYFITRNILKPEEILFWGTYGKDGKSPLKYILLLDMESDHLEACLRTQKHLTPIYKQTMQKLLRQRKLKKLNGDN